jgi:hypothetical protein
MTKKISFPDLVKNIHDDTITKQQIQNHFEEDYLATSAGPLKPRFKLNYSTVDVTGVEKASAAAANELALDAQRRVQTRGVDARAVSIIAEGDSWFSHPLNKTVIDVLQQKGHAIHNMAHAGDTLEEMVTKAEYLPDLKSGGITHFLFSGGGNDFLGMELELCIQLYDHFHASPNDAPYYIKDEFRQQLAIVRSNYAVLLNQVAAASPSTILIVDGYAYARPHVAGQYIGSHFEYLGFDLAVHADLARAIVKLMVDRFNAFLKHLAQSNSKVRYVDFRQTIRQNVDGDWFDYELHPSASAAARMAKQYEQILAIA